MAINDEKVELRHKAGQGNWSAFCELGLSLENVIRVAGQWRHKVNGIDKPWLCWNVDGDWCTVQQLLIRHAGWTPVIGFDPRVGPPKWVVPGSVVIDFNQGIDLPVLYPHFPLEFCFIWCEKLAFWHSDLLIRPNKMTSIAQKFLSLTDGTTAATWAFPGVRYALSQRKKRYWELIGCTTKKASLDQFNKGCGWWMAFWAHPNCPDEYTRQNIKEKYYWDHGAGIYYWRRNFGGQIVEINEKYVKEGHFTAIGNSNYEKSWVAIENAQRHMSIDIKVNFELTDVCQRLGLTQLIGENMDLVKAIDHSEVES